MRILQVHNKYLHYGGEDAVVENENKLLSKNNVIVKQVFFDNTNISPANFFYNTESYNIIKKELIDFKPNVMHVHNIFYQATPSILRAAKDTGIPVVMTLHNFRLLCPGGLFLRDSKVCTKCKDITFPYYAVFHKCFQNSLSKSIALSYLLGLNKKSNFWNNTVDRFIVLTPFIKDLMLDSSLNLIKEKVIVKPNSTDDFLADSAPIDKREGFLFVGRLSKEKGIDLLVRACNKMTQYELRIIGIGELETLIKNKAKNNITFYGKKDRDFIKNKLMTSKALIFPSIWYEGLPNTIIEAFSSGTPVLCSNIDNINQLIINNFNGELFEANNIESIIEKVREFSKKNTLIYQTNARSTFVKKYKHEINLQNLMKIYTETINESEHN
jgi:glycosyltransferase involved in cell wall biosynthesis